MTHAQYMFKREGSRGGKNNTCKGMEARGLAFLPVHMEGLRPGGSRPGGWRGYLWAVGTCGGFNQEGDEETLPVPFTLPHLAVRLLSHVQLFAAPWTAAHQASLSFTISQNLLRLMSIESVMPSNHLVLCHPLLLLPSMFPNIRWPKHWSFSFSTSPPMNSQG